MSETISAIQWTELLSDRAIPACRLDIGLRSHNEPGRDSGDISCKRRREPCLRSCCRSFSLAEQLDNTSQQARPWSDGLSTSSSVRACLHKPGYGLRLPCLELPSSNLSNHAVPLSNNDNFFFFFYASQRRERSRCACPAVEQRCSSLDIDLK